MAGLGTVEHVNLPFLSLAGGYIWNRKADQNDSNYATQDYETSEGTKTRSGARYQDFSGNITKVEFKTHDKYGESINVTVVAGDDSFIFSIATNNRYSQDFMKALLVMDLDKEFYMKPYDFIDKDGRRAQGIVFRQDGEKLNLRNDDAPSKDKDWFKTADKKKIRRFFEDLSDWFVAEVEEKVIPQLDSKENTSAPSGLGNSEPAATADEVEEADEAPAPTEADPRVSPLKMKKFLKGYIEENYGETYSLPKLSKEDLVNWYNLALDEEELPFEEGSTEGAQVSQSDLDEQLNNLLP